MCTEQIKISYQNIEFEISSKFRKKTNELIVCIHGLGCSMDNFDSIWNFGPLLPYSILTFDLPGFGNSTNNDLFSYELNDHAEICAALLARYKEYRIHLLGHSMGGAIALILSEKILGQLQSFINVEGNLISHDSTISRRHSSLTFEHFRENDFPLLVRTLELSNEPGRNHWANTIKKSDPLGFYLSSRSLVSWSDSGQLLNKFKSLSCKKVYIHGDKNSFMRILTRLNKIPVVSIPHSGHFPMIDNPNDFYNYLAEFLAN